jgi:cytosine/adenosine deaminase-related metal-dependent hydrolase
MTPPRCEPTVLEHGTVLTLDRQRRIIDDGAIAWSAAGRLEAVGKAADFSAERWSAYRRIDLGGDYVLPGLIDTHVHLAQALLRGCADDLSLVEWLRGRVWPLQGNFTSDDGRLSAELCILEMLLSGTTGFIETLIHERYGLDGIAEVCAGAGIRSCLAKSVMDSPAYEDANNTMHPGMVEEGERSVRLALEAHERWEGKADGRISVWFGCRTIGGASPELVSRVCQLASNRGMGVTIHFCEVESNVTYIQQTYGQSAGELAEACGLLGPRRLLVHAVWLSDDDITRIARSGTHVSHNPASNCKVALGICPVSELLAAGVNVALGCDGGPSNNTYDLMRDLRWVAGLAKARTLDPQTVTAEQVLEMATLGGARAAGWVERTGSLEEGKEADVVVVDAHSVGMTPSPSPASALVYGATGADVRHVWVQGRQLVREQTCLVIDQVRVLMQARERAADLYERTGLATAVLGRWPRL